MHLKLVKISAMALALAFSGANLAHASSNTLSYGGRITEASGKPLTGDALLRVKFFRTQTGDASLISVSLPDFNVTVSDGLFQLALNLSDADFHEVFNGVDPAWIQVTDVTHGKTYPRQSFSLVPYALKVPTDDVVFKYDTDGKLTLKADPVANRVLGADGSGELTWIDLTGSGLGDMLAGTWDGDANSKIDEADHAMAADDADELGGQLPGFYTNAANIPETATRKWFSDTERAKLSALAAGADMLKSTYDTNADGKVNSAVAADNATQLNGQAASYYTDAANIPETATRKWLSDTERTKLSGITAGADMLKSTYDTNADGKVNSAAAADNATQLNGQGASYYTDAANIPETATRKWLSDTERTKLSGITTGADMLKSTYDTNADGKVNSAAAADNATQLNGQAASFYNDAGNLTGTILDARIPSAIARDTELPTAASIATGFAADAVSGDKVDGGTISNFASTGIDDNADALAITIDANERLGVGTVAPNYKLDTWSSTALTNSQADVGGFLAESTGDMADGFGGALKFHIKDAGANQGVVSMNWYRDGADNSGALGIWTRNAGAYGQNLTIKASGNVGIGQTAPDQKLDVNGPIKIGTGATCAPAQAGSLRYNAGIFEGCNGTSWSAFGGTAAMGGVQYFTSSGTFTVPSGITKAHVEVWGGGGGGSCSASGSGGNGGTTTFVGYLSATGGTGATAVYYAKGGAGGVGSSGDINLTGGKGRTGSSYSSPDGGASPMGGAGGNAGEVGFAGGDTLGLPGVFPGGGGGGAWYSGVTYGAGGGGGGYAAKWVTGLSGTVTVTVGAGGTANTANCGAGAGGMVKVSW